MISGEPTIPRWRIRVGVTLFFAVPIMLCFNFWWWDCVYSRDKAVKRLAGTNIQVPKNWIGVVIYVDDGEPIGVGQWPFGPAKQSHAFTLSAALCGASILGLALLMVSNWRLQRNAPPVYWNSRTQQYVDPADDPNATPDSN